ncbi:hypothetical protein EDEG_02386 [Edhazardia aedis USNM 41457]|uniref:Uncharacterized protein n=1 Tax=Edhazardia aedis (strain USNM 41457) TaxID=1003232 RepID=J8ZU74_EDHAE|nr:hypothetical protein EDEG_02386 [Edhazardia aedis USNM 41457]|eukprot:EJW03218.1 hypothetical protein EDEG_02386 [Edhazardia aedis USNM 41457]
MKIVIENTITSEVTCNMHSPSLKTNTPSLIMCSLANLPQYHLFKLIPSTTEE